MTKNFIKVGGTYKAKNCTVWNCISVEGEFAYCKIAGLVDTPAYPFKLDGMPAISGRDLLPQLLPPKPNIEKSDANLWYSSTDGWVLSHLRIKIKPNGILYIHPEAKVALFVPENINGETLAEAIGALQAEIGG